MISDTKFDLIVIGAGSGGLTMAAVAAQLGYKVALLEGNKMGGDCLNYGCVPSKALLAAAKAAHHSRTSANFGVKTGSVKVDMEAVHKHVHSVIAKIEPHDSQQRFEKLGVTVIREYGFFIDKKTIGTESGLQLKGRRIIIATGSRPFVPPVTGLDKVDYLTNETIFNLKKLPKELLIVGGGAIGVEMAQAYSRLGSKVTLIEGAEHILPNEDADIAEVIHNRLVNEGVEIITGYMLQSVKNKGSNNITLVLNKKKQAITVTGSDLLMAVGRAPNTEKLELENAGIKLNGRMIKTNSSLQTTNRKVYAVGDVAGPYQFTHTAGYQAGHVIRHVLFGMFWAKIKYNAVPWCTYTDPELATVGMNEKTARAAYGNKVTITKVSMSENDRAIAEKQTDGVAKLITVNGKLKGVTIVAPNAGELIALWTLCLNKKLPLSAIGSMIHAYPTLGDISRHMVSTFYKPALQSEKTKSISRLLFRVFG